MNKRQRNTLKFQNDEESVVEKFTFFYRQDSPFSQFHYAEFQGKPLFPDNSNENFKFVHCEQWMMFNKAKLFGDHVSAKHILESSSPMVCKRFGRKVQNFNQKIWNENNLKIIYEGNHLKFTQNPHLLKELMDTNGTTLVEASPTDTIYGIGLSKDNPLALNRSTWRGKNLLGETLTKLREDLIT